MFDLMNFTKPKKRTLADAEREAERLKTPKARTRQ